MLQQRDPFRFIVIALKAIVLKRLSVAAAYGSEDPMVSTSHTHPSPAARAVSWLRDDIHLARLAIGVVALHVVDDNFLQPNPGTTAGGHLVSGLLPLALLVAAGAFYGRLRPGARAVIAFLAGYGGVTSFTWTPSGQSEIRVICPTWSRVRLHKQAASISARFVRVPA